MYQTSTLIFKFSSKEDARSALPLLKAQVESIDDWNRRLMLCGSDITVGEDCYISGADYEGLVMKLCTLLSQTGSGWDFLCYAEYLSDDGEVHEYVRCRDGRFRGCTVREDYEQGNTTERSCTGVVNNHRLPLEESVDDVLLYEVRCGECGEYYNCSVRAPLSRCPYCGALTEHESEEIQAPMEEEEELSGWKGYKFQYPLEVTFPEKRISEGMDWLEDCEENDTFELDPACFPNKNQYDAALMLCKVCAGWYGFDSETERLEKIQCLRAVLRSEKGQPMWYYDVWHRSFDWVAALRDCNNRYLGQFADVDSLWELFSRLQQRSCLEKATCFGWLVAFFGKNLRYDERGMLSDCYVQGYDATLETILYLFPDQIPLLTEGHAAVSSNGARYLARAAAGLVRMDRRKDGLELYEKVFSLVWNGGSSADDKKSVVDEFLTRLSAGYENEPYLDQEITELLEQQCQKYSDAKWTAKIRMMLGGKADRK